MSRPIIEVRNISKRYRLGVFNARTLRDEVELLWHRLRGSIPAGASRDQEELWAVKDVSFDVQPGEVLGIIGRNGAGKSTLLKILSRITEPTSGEVRVRGRMASLLEVGTGFHPELTGRENVFLNGAILGMTKAEIRKKFDEIVAFAEIERFIDTPVKRYSSGMYVRLAFAVAAHLEPEILILDEVLAVGDSSFQNKCLGKMQDVAAHGRTVLFVSHNMAAVARLCSNCILLHSGTVDAMGCTADILRQYLASTQAVDQSSVDLTAPNVKRRGTGRIQFSSFAIRNEAGEPASEIPVGSNFTVHVEFVSTATSHSTVLGFSFVTHDGVEVLGTAAHDSGVSTTIKPGKHRFVCQICPNVFLPGQYTIRAAVFTREELFDHIDAIMSFNISTVGREGTMPGGHKVGYVYLPYTWKIET